jgi:hypothetical protein
MMFAAGFHFHIVWNMEHIILEEFHYSRVTIAVMNDDPRSHVLLEAIQILEFTLVEEIKHFSIHVAV